MQRNYGLNEDGEPWVPGDERDFRNTADKILIACGLLLALAFGAVFALGFWLRTLAG